jgi:ABC-type nitrate/sulfonate/bicarbonate transport system ATPase subunit
LIHEPALLMLDEPFAALDMFTREELWGVLQEVWMTKSPTVILVTHDLREAVYLADKVYVMSSRPGASSMSARLSLPARASWISPSVPISATSRTICATISTPHDRMPPDGRYNRIAGTLTQR